MHVSKAYEVTKNQNTFINFAPSVSEDFQRSCFPFLPSFCFVFHIATWKQKIDGCHVLPKLTYNKSVIGKQKSHNRVTLHDSWTSRSRHTSLFLDLTEHF